MASSRRAAPRTRYGPASRTARALAGLRRRIERVLAEAGVAPERRKFAPHVTLGRFAAPPPEERFASYLFRRNLFRTAALSRSAASGSTRSQLRPEGSLYTLEADYDFVAGVAERV